MADVEQNSSRNQRPGVPQNPYSGQGPQLLPESHFINKVKRLVYISISVVGLIKFNFFRVVLHSPHINHEWFKVGLATTIAILGIKAYVELYEGKMKHNEVNYTNFRQTTHAVMILILLSTAAFNVSLWPHYGWNSPLVLGICFFGVILQFLLLVPTYVQNAVSFIALTFFLQQYK